MRTEFDLAVDNETIDFELDDAGIGWITIQRPDAANSRNQQVRAELAALYRAISRSREIRIVVLTGSGDRHFCAGMDLREANEPETELERRERLRSERDIELLAELPQPTLAAINGAALGGGCEMALACDLRVMANEAVIGLPETSHGLIPGGGGGQRLVRLVGIGKAFEMIYLGKSLDGGAAAAMGLVNLSVPRIELRDCVVAMANDLASMPNDALRAAKESIRRGIELPLSAATELELDLLLQLMAAGKTPGDGRSRR